MFRTIEWWDTVQPPSNYVELLRAFLTPAKSWSDEIDMWGRENGNRVDVSRDEVDTSRIVDIYVRVDVSQLDTNFVGHVANFASECDCLLSNENRNLLEPDAKLILSDIRKSRAFRFVENPRAYFESLKDDPIEDDDYSE